jgi:imidazole glycerol-phosphate synthase
MLDVLRKTSETVFVPLTIGGGIRDLTDPDGTVVPALQVAGEYFRSGADKVSIGSDAVYATEKYLAGEVCSNAITEISRVYGRQAVVISVDPRRIYVSDDSDSGHSLIKTQKKGPNGETMCWYQCTVKGGREGRDIDVKQLIQATTVMGAGEILLNCMDHDGQNAGFDHELISHVKSFATVPVVASSGAGCAQHFSDVFRVTDAEAALAAGIFHRREIPIAEVKKHLVESGYKIR